MPTSKSDPESSTTPATTTWAWNRAGAAFTDMMTPTLRLGVTGLSRAGKTIFITALIRTLLSGGRMPFFLPEAEGRIERAYLEPQPDDQVPRFDYEGHLAALARDPADWPESTRRLSQLRVTIEFRSESSLRRAFGVSKLHVDIVDYPGEWLIDLPLLNMDYAAWCAEAVTQAVAPRRQAHSKAWREFLATVDPYAPHDEQLALRGAELFADYLKAARAEDHVLHTTGPGRFLMPGELAGSPLLTFCPLNLDPSIPYGRNTNAGMMARRFESYKNHAVKPFFRDHFSRLDRQIVLVDVLGPLNEGGDAVVDLEHALSSVLSVFKIGSGSWFSALFTRRIDKLLFAATKADHIHASSHDRLEAILRVIIDRAMGRAVDSGAEVGVQALASLRATREADAKVDGELLPCIVGVPMPGERIGNQVFNGRTEAAIFPGDLPANPRDALKPDAAPAGLHFVRFRPPRLLPPGADGESPPLPHIRLDRALDFLLSDWLA
ncbi:Amino acid regulated cytosolic protein [Hyphomicrobium sulfonivorans]|uniref:Amino acid regulated cytosolic protein n=1 Tax=Hyphomicrobium sulfonivorans TaxID=121290 RepID=A0A109BNK9_HYPSL|nr:YcjX family protein [Hyphomicrobium sulfonivorans]KWT72063.1 Amino acid regulated cytosolic protein [Hyphomicrobium sulfonivorans]